MEFEKRLLYCKRRRGVISITLVILLVICLTTGSAFAANGDIAPNGETCDGFETSAVAETPETATEDPIGASTVPIDPTVSSVVMIAMPDPEGSGGTLVYTGEEAQRIYAKLQSDPCFAPETSGLEPEHMEEQSVTPTSGSDHRAPYGMFTYKYRYIQKESGSRKGRSTRISPYAANLSSIRQSLAITLSTSVNWGINADISGGFRNAVTAHLGASWNKNYSVTRTVNVSVAPKKKAWVEFCPLIKYSKGVAQKYYVTRGPLKTEIVAESKSVSTTSCQYIIWSLGGENFAGPDGTLIGAVQDTTVE